MTATTLPAEYLVNKTDDQLLSLEKLLRIRATRLRFAQDCHRSTNGNRMQFDAYPHIVELYNNPSPHIVLQGCVQSMKALPNDALVHTPSGWRRNGDLKIGDAVTRPSGGEAHITHVQPFAQKQMYSFTLSDGRTVESCEDHLWEVLRDADWEVLSTKEIVSALTTGTQFTLPTPVAVEKPHADVPLNPYVLGRFLASRHPVSDRSLFDVLASMGLFRNKVDDKFVPHAYKENSVVVRQAVLRGIYDTYCTVDKGIEFEMTSKQLVEDVREIVWSLGGTASKVDKRGGYWVNDAGERVDSQYSYSTHISWPNPNGNSGPKIESASPSEVTDATCIMLDDDEHLYLTNNYVVTHNSEWLIVDHFAMAHEGLSVFFVVPKFEMRNTFVQNRVNRCVERVDEYKKIIGESFFDSIAIKSFGKGVIKYVGSNVLSDFKEFPADAIFIDEVDECDADNVHYGRDRLRGSPFQFIRQVGNPKFEGKGIHAFFLESDGREWFVPCSTCGKMAETDWFTTVVEAVKDKEGNTLNYKLRDTEWVAGIGRDIRMICPLCGGTLERASKRGVWVPARPESTVVGYHMSMLCSPINSVSGMWAEFAKAQNDPRRLQQFYNSCLGLPYSAEGSKVTENLLVNSVDPNMHFVVEGTLAHLPDHKHPGPCVMGIDVGGNFDVHISSKEDNPRRRAACIGKVKQLDDLFDLVKRYNVQHCVIDSMPEANLARDFQLGCIPLGCDVWLCRYGSEGVDRGHQLNAMTRVITVDRTSALDKSFGQLRAAQNILPVNFGTIQGFVDEMCLPIRQVTTDNRGNTKYEWKKGADHARHADTYAMLANELFGEAIIEDVYVG